MSDLNFGQAIEALKSGKKVTRTGWNGKGMWLTYVGSGYCTLSFSVIDGTGYSKVPEVRPWIGMKTVDDQIVPWVASQTDILAEDWGVIV